MREASRSRRPTPQTRQSARFFLGPIEIAGYYAGLAAGLRELGHEALAVDINAHRFGYADGLPPPPAVVRAAIWARAGGRGKQSWTPVRAAWRTIRLGTRLLLLLWAIPRFDVFVFGFGTSILWLRELGLLRRLGKRLVFVFHGSDARPPYIDGVRVGPDRAPSVDERIAMTRRLKQEVRQIERHASVVIAQPAFSHFFERPVIDWFAVGLPWRARRPVDRTPPADGPIRILHSPSDPVAKGSLRIREVVTELCRAGLPIEFVELREMPNQVVWSEIHGCHFVIDQLYSDAPMVGFATEAAAAGRPAIVGGYAWPENHRILRVSEMPPVEECRPEELAAAIRRLVQDPDHREALGRRARAFVASWSARAVAERLVAVADGAAPADWWFDPRELRYVEGCGLSREAARESVAAILAAGGRAALCLADKPELEQRFVDFAGSSR